MDEKQGFKTIKEITFDEIDFYLEKIKGELWNVWTGDTYSWRHDVFNQGGHDKFALMFKLPIREIEDDQVQHVNDSLMLVYGNNERRFMQYIYKVLLPEAVIRICMEMNPGINFEEAERIMSDTNNSNDQENDDSAVHNPFDSKLSQMTVGELRQKLETNEGESQFDATSVEKEFSDIMSLFRHDSGELHT